MPTLRRGPLSDPIASATRPPPNKSAGGGSGAKGGPGASVGYGPGWGGIGEAAPAGDREAAAGTIRTDGGEGSHQLVEVEDLPSNARRGVEEDRDRDEVSALRAAHQR